MTLPPALTIRPVSVRAVEAPLEPPLRNSLNTIPRAPLVIAEVQTAEGPAGNAYVFPYTPAALGPTATLVRNIGAGLAGRGLACPRPSTASCRKPKDTPWPQPCPPPPPPARSRCARWTPRPPRRCATA